MSAVEDVAVHILENLGTISTMKLQKLVYYSQAYNLVCFDMPLFSEKIEAWVNGPVVPKLYETHKRQSVVGASDLVLSCPSGEVSDQEISSIEHVISCLGSYNGVELSQLTHSEDPWKDARIGLQVNERSQNIITIEKIKEFYSSAACKNPAFV